jgi:hypothetical protein
MVRFNYEGTLYGFERDFQGEGRWAVVEGKCPALVGMHQKHINVPLSFDQELTGAARDQGVSESHKFSRFIPKPPPPVKVPREKKPKQRKANSLVGMGIRLNILNPA